MDRLIEWAAPEIAVPAYPTEAYLEKKVLNDFDQAVITRLAAYEDSGLEPEEVKSAYEAGRQDALLEPDWISVKDMLPDEEDDVLLLVREVEHYGIHGRKRKVHRLVFTGWRIDDEWATFYCNGHQMLDEEDKKHPNCQFTVTHWMPLPKPPKEVEHETD